MESTSLPLKQDHLLLDFIILKLAHKVSCRKSCFCQHHGLVAKTVKNHKGSRILPYLQATKLCFSVHGCLKKPWDAWVRGKGLYYPWHSKQYEDHLSDPWQRDLDGYSVYSGFASQLNNAKLRKISHFYNKQKQVCSLPGESLLYPSRLPTSNTTLRNGPGKEK